MAVRRTRVNGNNASSSSPPSVEPAAPREKGPPNVRDILRRKEEEVKQMLAPEKDMSEMDIMVNKILVEVKAFESRGGSQGAESGEFTYLAAVETAAQFKCPTCGNRDQSNFTLDSKQGDTICLGADGRGCGTVVQDHKDAGKLRNLAEDVEMGLSTIGKDERKTRTAYKDQMKREAFDLINHIAGNCDLHEVVTVRAKELFAGWRNVKEHVHNKHAVICACIIGAYREIGTEELSRLFQRRQLLGIKGTNGDQEDPLYPFVCPKCKTGYNEAKALEFHQKEVHKSVKAERKELGRGPTTPYSEWSLSDAREWLTSVVEALKLPAEHAESICKAVEKNIGGQGQRQKVGVKRKATKTAGQVLMMLSLGALTNLCGAGPEGAQAAAKLHHETTRKRAAKARVQQSRVADQNAAQRRNQIVRKPWVAHVNNQLKRAVSAEEREAEEDTRSRKRRAVSPLTADAAVTAPGAASPEAASIPAIPAEAFGVPLGTAPINSNVEA